MARPIGEISVLSAGAPKTGVARCAKVFEVADGRSIAVTFATAPIIRERMHQDAAAWDVVIAPLPAMRTFEEESRVITGNTIVIGTIAAGLVVREGAPTPDITSVGSLKEACLNADALVYNQASSGQRIAEMMDRLGIADAVAAKTVRVATGRAVMERLAQGTGHEIGFGQITEIRVHADRGVNLVGALPPGVEIMTTYAAGLTAGNVAAGAGQAFVAFMATATGRSIFAEAGLT